MSAVVVFIVMAIIVIVGAIIVYFLPKPATPQPFVPSITPVSSWGTSVPLTANPQGKQLTYTFAANVDNNNIITYSNPTLDYKTLIYNSAGVPSGSTATNPIFVSTNVTCTDTDQSCATLVQRTCVGGGSQGYGCVTKDGTITTVGKTEDFFSACTVPLCSNDPCFIAVNFSATPPITLLTINADNSITAQKATANLRQLWRIFRADPISLAPNDNGVYFKMVDRVTNNSLDISGVARTGAPLILNNAPINAGYVWLMTPPITITGPTGTPLNLPQQLVYSPDGQPLPSSDDILSWLVMGVPGPILDIKRYSVQFSGGVVQLNKFAIVSDATQTTQIINFTLYNVLSIASTGTYPIFPTWPGTL